MKILTNEKYESLLRQIDTAKQELKRQKEVEEYLNKKISGDRCTGNYCEVCEHSYRIYNCMGGYYSYGCLLDVKCQDFKKKE